MEEKENAEIEFIRIKESSLSTIKKIPEVIVSFSSFALMTLLLLDIINDHIFDLESVSTIPNKKIYKLYLMILIAIASVIDIAFKKWPSAYTKAMDFDKAIKKKDRFSEELSYSKTQQKNEYDDFACAIFSFTSYDWDAYEENRGESDFANKYYQVLREQGWEKWHCIDKNGYQAVAYKNSRIKQVIIAHRGTDEKQDQIANLDSIVFNGDQESYYWLRKIIKFIFKYKDYQYETVSREFIKDVSKKTSELSSCEEYNIVHTGHSLGGWLAVYAAAYHLEFFKYKIGRVVTFDCPGTAPMLERINLSTYQDLNVINYLSEPNPVNTCHPHFGKMFRIYPPVIILHDQSEVGAYSWLHKTVDAHSMQNILLSFNPETRLPYKIRRILNWPSDGSKVMSDLLDGFAMYLSNSDSLSALISLPLLSLYHSGNFVFCSMDHYLKLSSPFIYHESASKYYLQEIERKKPLLKRLQQFNKVVLLHTTFQKNDVLLISTFALFHVPKHRGGGLIIYWIGNGELCEECISENRAGNIFKAWPKLMDTVTETITINDTKLITAICNCIFPLSFIEHYDDMLLDETKEKNYKTDEYLDLTTKTNYLIEDFESESELQRELFINKVISDKEIIQLLCKKIENIEEQLQTQPEKKPPQLSQPNNTGKNPNTFFNSQKDRSTYKERFSAPIPVLPTVKIEKMDKSLKK